MAGAQRMGGHNEEIGVKIFRGPLRVIRQIRVRGRSYSSFSIFDLMTTNGADDDEYLRVITRRRTPSKTRRHERTKRKKKNEGK